MECFRKFGNFHKFSKVTCPTKTLSWAKTAWLHRGHLHSCKMSQMWQEIHLCENIGWLGLHRGHLVKKNSLRRQRHQRVNLRWVSYFVWFDCLGAEEDDTLDWARGPGVLGLGVYVYNCFCISFIFIMSWIVPGVQEYWAPSEQQNIWEKYRNRLLHIICQRCWKRA